MRARCAMRQTVTASTDMVPRGMGRTTRGLHEGYSKPAIHVAMARAECALCCHRRRLLAGMHLDGDVGAGSRPRVTRRTRTRDSTLEVGPERAILGKPN